MKTTEEILEKIEELHAKNIKASTLTKSLGHLQRAKNIKEIARHYKALEHWIKQGK